MIQGELLKKYREQNNLTIKDNSNSLSDHGREGSN